MWLLAITSIVYVNVRMLSKYLHTDSLTVHTDVYVVFDKPSVRGLYLVAAPEDLGVADSSLPLSLVPGPYCCEPFAGGVSRLTGVSPQGL